MHPVLALIALHVVLINFSFLIYLPAYLAEVALLHLVMTVLAYAIDAFIPQTLSFLLKGAEKLVTRDTVHTVLAEPIVLRDLRQRWRQTVDMDGFVTHIANDDLVFIIIHVAYVAGLTISTFPRESLHKLHIQGWL